MALRLRLAAGCVIARVHLPDMRRIRASALVGVAGEIEIVVALVVARDRRDCRAAAPARAARRLATGRTSVPRAALRQCRAAPPGRTQIDGTRGLSAPAAGTPCRSRCAARAPAGATAGRFFRDPAGPGPGSRKRTPPARRGPDPEVLDSAVSGGRSGRQAADAGLRYAVAETKMLAPAQGTGPSVAGFGIDDLD